ESRGNAAFPYFMRSDAKVVLARLERSIIIFFAWSSNRGNDASRLLQQKQQHPRLLRIQPTCELVTLEHTRSRKLRLFKRAVLARLLIRYPSVPKLKAS